MPRLIYRVGRMVSRLLIVASATAFVATSLAYQWHNGRVETNRLWLKHSNDVLLAVARLADNIGRSEALAKGYLSDRDPAERLGYIRQKTDLMESAQKLRWMVVDNPAQVAAATKVIRESERAILRFDEAVEGRADPRPMSALRDSVRIVRAAVADFDAEEIRLRETRRDSLTRGLAVAHYLALSAIGIASVFLISGFINWLIPAVRRPKPGGSYKIPANLDLPTVLAESDRRLRECEQHRLDDASTITFLKLKLDVLADRFRDDEQHVANLATIEELREAVNSLGEETSPTDKERGR